MRDDKPNVIIELTFKFSLSIIDYCDKLESERKYVLARQLLKSGTSIGANSREAQNAESKDDFIHKFKVAAKEADETEYWLLLCKSSEHYPDIGNLLIDLAVIIKVISKILAPQKDSSETRFSNFQINTFSN